MKGAFRPTMLDDVDLFKFRPYIAEHDFQENPFFYPSSQFSPYLSDLELFLATGMQSIPSYNACSGPSA